MQLNILFLALVTAMLSVSHGFRHFPSHHGFGGLFDRHLHDIHRPVSLLDRQRLHRRPEPSPEQKLLHQLRQTEDQIHALERQHEQLAASSFQLQQSVTELEQIHSSRYGQYQAALDELHPRSHRFFAMQRQAQHDLGEIRSRYQRSQRQLHHVQDQLKQVDQRLHQWRNSRMSIKDRLSLLQPKANLDSTSYHQPEPSLQQPPLHHRRAHEQHPQQSVHQHSTRPLQPHRQDQSSSVSESASSPAARNTGGHAKGSAQQSHQAHERQSPDQAVPRSFKVRRQQRQSPPSSPVVDVRAGIEYDDDGTPWQAGGIWTGVEDETTMQQTEVTTEQDDHDEHLMYMKEIREYLYR
eukprot:TRINITY_DN8152_c0_g3_i1.p1 TRINITY_DN8152_c0_g3~~TRINITY_DN8152_c0_g3_i1.p1  ORF type:complete len:352 (+),score=62.48 TRINITY_DN8152_c0_g3_i1:157-1212(+)